MRDVGTITDLLDGWQKISVVYSSISRSGHLYRQSAIPFHGWASFLDNSLCLWMIGYSQRWSTVASSEPHRKAILGENRIFK